MTGSLATPRNGHSAVLLPNGKVLIVGGYNASGDIFPSPELYDPATGSFSPTGNLRTPRHSASATLLVDGRVLVAGGIGVGVGTPELSSSKVYDPATGTWQETGNLAAPRLGHAAFRLNDGRVLVAGGAQYFSEDFGNTYSDTAELYDPATGVWSAAQGDRGPPGFDDFHAVG